MNDNTAARRHSAMYRVVTGVAPDDEQALDKAAAVVDLHRFSVTRAEYEAADATTSVSLG